MPHPQTVDNLLKRLKSDGDRDEPRRHVRLTVQVFASAADILDTVIARQMVQKLTTTLARALQIASRPRPIGPSVRRRLPDRPIAWLDRELHAAAVAHGMDFTQELDAGHRFFEGHIYWALRADFRDLIESGGSELALHCLVNGEWLRLFTDILGLIELADVQASEK